MTTKNEKKQMEAKGGKKCTQSKAKESKPAASNKKSEKKPFPKCAFPHITPHFPMHPQICKRYGRKALLVLQ